MLFECICQLLDTNRDNMINFRDFVNGLGIMCRADLTERLKLMYRLHQPPALLPTDQDEFEMAKSGKILVFKCSVILSYFISIKPYSN